MEKAGENARGAAVISSPISGVFAVTAAGPGLRRGHVIYSGVFAVAAVTAAGVPRLVRSLACPASSAEASRARWSASRRRLVLRIADDSRSSPASWAFRMTVVLRVVPARHDEQRLCGREASWRRLPRPPATAQALKRLASGSALFLDGITAGGQVARRPGLQRAHHAGYAPAGPR